MFKKKKYTVIRQAISKDLAAFVANYFCMQKQVYDTCRATRYISPFENIIGNYESKDEQIPETYSQYSNIAMETLMLKCQPEMEKITGLKLYPAYTYARIYKNGSDLKIHTDRPECQYSVTLCLGGEYEKPWPIWIKDYAGKSHEVPLDVGDMVVYHGTELEHWREKFEGNMQYQLFMHYVDSEGEFKDRIYDGRPNLGLKK